MRGELDEVAQSCVMSLLVGKVGGGGGLSPAGPIRRRK